MVRYSLNYTSKYPEFDSQESFCKKTVKQDMSRISKNEGIERARLRLGIEHGAPAYTWWVRRIDRPSEPYYLIVFGDPQAALGVAAVDIVSGEMMNWATLPGTGSHSLIDYKAVFKRAGLPTSTHAELVWKSCQGSRSPLYPLWEICVNKKIIYVDQQGVIWHSLESSVAGG